MCFLLNVPGIKNKTKQKPGHMKVKGDPESKFFRKSVEFFSFTLQYLCFVFCLLDWVVLGFCWWWFLFCFLFCFVLLCFVFDELDSTWFIWTFKVCVPFSTKTLPAKSHKIPPKPLPTQKPHKVTEVAHLGYEASKWPPSDVLFFFSLLVKDSLSSQSH